MIPYHSQRTYYEGFLEVLEAKLILLESKNPRIPKSGLSSFMEITQHGRKDALKWLQSAMQRKKGRMELTDKEQKVILRFYKEMDTTGDEYLSREYPDGTMMHNRKWFQAFRQLVRRIKNLHGHETNKL